MPGPALAHAPLAGAGDFYAGLLHPLTDLPAILPLLALALLAGRTGGEPGLWAALAAAAAAFGGGVLAVRGSVMATAATLLGGAALVSALLVAADRRPPPVLLLPLTALAGGALGYVQVSEVRSLAFVGGVALAVALTLLYGVTLVGRVQAPWGCVAVRIAGSWLVAIEALMLGLTLR